MLPTLTEGETAVPLKYTQHHVFKKKKKKSVAEEVILRHKTNPKTSQPGHNIIRILDKRTLLTGSLCHYNTTCPNTFESGGVKSHSNKSTFHSSKLSVSTQICQQVSGAGPHLLHMRVTARVCVFDKEREALVHALLPVSW